MPSYYSYKLSRDYGFAPNPFHGYCTLATCKPRIRKVAQSGDWVIGSGSKELGHLGRVIYLMEVDEVVGLDAYWNDGRFISKRPLMNGSLVQAHGDNIYSLGSSGWVQSDSHHSLESGGQNPANLKKDTSGLNVLVSKNYFYFGSRSLSVPKEFAKVLCKVRDFCKVRDVSCAEAFISWVRQNCQTGVTGDPISWRDYSQRSLFQ